MRERNEKAYQAKKEEVMEKCFECYAEHGLMGTGIKALADACGFSKASIYTYFDSLDDLIIESTAYCMAKIEDEFMAKAPHDPKDIPDFFAEMPYWAASRHGKKYRLMYQIYTHPKYLEHGKKFFDGVNRRYTEYAKQLEHQLGIPYMPLTSLIFTFSNASIHYAMFQDEFYLETQLEMLKHAVPMIIEKYSKDFV